jgi:hypothetical protein
LGKTVRFCSAETPGLVRGALCKAPLFACEVSFGCRHSARQFAGPAFALNIEGSETLNTSRHWLDTGERTLGLADGEPVAPPRRTTGSD